MASKRHRATPRRRRSAENAPPASPRAKVYASSFVTVTRARELLCPLVRGLSKQPSRTIGIVVAGDVAAYLVSAKRLEALEENEKLHEGVTPRPSIRGTLEIAGDIEQGSRDASIELQQTALRSWEQQAH